MTAFKTCGRRNSNLNIIFIEPVKYFFEVKRDVFMYIILVKDVEYLVCISYILGVVSPDKCDMFSILLTHYNILHLYTYTLWIPYAWKVYDICESRNCFPNGNGSNGNVFSFEAIVQYFVCITSIGFLFL